MHEYLKIFRKYDEKSKQLKKRSWINVDHLPQKALLSNLPLLSIFPFNLNPFADSPTLFFAQMQKKQNMNKISHIVHFAASIWVERKLRVIVKNMKNAWNSKKNKMMKKNRET